MVAALNGIAELAALVCAFIGFSDCSPLATVFVVRQAPFLRWVRFAAATLRPTSFRFVAERVLGAIAVEVGLLAAFCDSNTLQRKDVEAVIFLGSGAAAFEESSFTRAFMLRHSPDAQDCTDRRWRRFFQEFCAFAQRSTHQTRLKNDMAPLLERFAPQGTCASDGFLEAMFELLVSLAVYCTSNSALASMLSLNIAAREQEEDRF